MVEWTHPYLVVTVSGDGGLHFEGEYADQAGAAVAASGTGGYVLVTSQFWGW